MASSQFLRERLLPRLLSSLLVLLLVPCVRCQLVDLLGANSTQQILFPSQGDLLIGRVPHLTASSTCGEIVPRVYCPSGQAKCPTCDSKHEWDKDLNPYSHKIGNVVAKIRNANTTYDSWWMSEPGVENVTIQLDLDAKFTFTHLIMIFHDRRPKAWWLERSADYGETYKPYGYYAEKCEDVFPWVKTGIRSQIDDVVCTNAYTDMSPPDKGEVVFNSIPQHISEAEMFNEVSRDRREAQTHITNLRIHLVKYHTLSDEKISSDRSEMSRYYFGLYEMNVHGMCICNGHASTCKPADGVTVVDRNAVYGYCECMHNTQGPNCEECRDFYHDRRWAPATLTSSNECRRCQCYGHSNKCAFSQKKWDESGGITGGTCLDCMHNTTGDNCQRCSQGFYRDEARQLEDPDICAPCECSTAGIKELFCEPETDKAKGLIAGYCHCKANVGGRNCDRCKPGYWDLRQDNPEGCQVCDCLLLGTTDNQGCNQYTGQCPCKANVDGEKCNRCKPGFFNLSQIDTGCSACECDIGGSLGATCHPVTGDCSCRPGFGGRKCDVVLDRHYVPNFDIDGTIVDVAESPDSGRFPRVTKPEEPTITGRSALRLKSPTMRTPDELVIPLRNRTIGLPAGEYDIALKVYPRRTNATVELPVLLDAGTAFVNCTRRPPALDTSLMVPATSEFNANSQGMRPYQVSTVFRKVCIDAAGLDKITVLLFKMPQSDEIFIDAVIIGKELDDPISYQLNKKASTNITLQFKMGVNVTMTTSLYNCLDYWKLQKQQAHQMPEECRRLVQSLSGRNLPAAFQCSCDGYGARSPTCSKIGGQCPCWPNVVGRTCSQCAERHYGFGQLPGEGCRACGCSVSGSTSDQCDAGSGQCPCLHPNIDGRQCDRCRQGYWNFPICVECQCNGLAADCNKATGVCLDCGNSTAGSYCQDCQTGFYGDPTRRIACRPCQCPGGKDGTVQHAVTCQLSSDSPPTARCNCQSGYLGDNCERCAVNYYGDPLTGDCTRCSCNGNINFSVPNSCDPDTGRCLRCLNQTTGANCEECRPGFHGQAAAGLCQPCTCSRDGTAPAALLPNPIKLGNQQIEYTCNSKTGLCDCLPNVEGPRCDTCKPLHYNLTSGAGCTPCECDSIGSTGLQCDLVTGQCPCRVGRGGRRCDQCQDLYFGDPTKPGQDGCLPCDCHTEGSQTNWCDKVTGRCVCKAAITGRQCDQCERGTTGTLPNCTTCGECWYNWDKLISGLNGTAAALRDRANRTAQRGDFAGELGDRLNEIDRTLGQIWMGINETRIPGQLAVDVQRKLAWLTNEFEKIKDIPQREAAVKEQLAWIKSSGLPAMNEQIDQLNQAHLKPKREIDQIRNSLSDPSLLTPSTALGLILDGKVRVEEAERNLSLTNATVQQEAILTERNRAAFANVSAEAAKLNGTLQDQSNSTMAIFWSVERTLPELNKEMCVGHNDPSVFLRARNYCSDVCGGPSKDVCNSTAASSQCADSTVCAKSVVARMRALEANMAALGGKIQAAATDSENETRSLSALKENTSRSDIAATNTEQNVNALKEEYEQLRKRASQMSADIERFLASNRTTLVDIEALVNRIEAASEIFLPPEVEKLSTQLQLLLSKVRGEHNVSRVIEDTREARATVSELLRVASQVAADAKLLKSAADNLTQLLGGAERSRAAAEALLGVVEQRLASVANVTDQMSSAIDTYNRQATEGTTKASAVRDQLQRSQASQLSEGIAGLNREQEDNRRTVIAAGQALTQATDRAADSGAALSTSELMRRQQAISNLRRRIESLKVGGDRFQSSNMDDKLKKLEVSMETGLNRLAALMLKLNDDGDTSLLKMITSIENSLCKRA